MSKPFNIIFSQLQKSFGKRVILQNTDLELRGGNCIQLGGVNGAGKSTLLRILSGLEKPGQGFVDFGCGPMKWKHARKQLQNCVMYLHQQPYMFEGSVAYNLAYSLNKLPAAVRRKRTAEAAEWAQLTHLLHADANTLSGGEKQRVALARAWLHQPQVMLLDEPTANLDSASRAKTLQLLKTLKQDGIAVVIASHDSSHFFNLFDVYLDLSSGRLQTLERPPETLSAPAENVTPIHKASA